MGLLSEVDVDRIWKGGLVFLGGGFGKILVREGGSFGFDGVSREWKKRVQDCKGVYRERYVFLFFRTYREGWAAIAGSLDVKTSKYIGNEHVCYVACITQLNTLVGREAGNTVLTGRPS